MVDLKVGQMVGCSVALMARKTVDWMVEKTVLRRDLRLVEMMDGWMVEMKVDLKEKLMVVLTVV